MDDNEYKASLDHIIITIYEYDKENDNFELRTLNKLHDHHYI